MPRIMSSGDLFSFQNIVFLLLISQQSLQFSSVSPAYRQEAKDFALNLGMYTLFISKESLGLKMISSWFQRDLISLSKLIGLLSVSMKQSILCISDSELGGCLSSNSDQSSCSSLSFISTNSDIFQFSYALVRILSVFPNTLTWQLPFLLALTTC